MKFTFRRSADDRGWPGYLFGGRMRTSTVGLIVAFLFVWWVFAVNQPETTPTPATPDVNAPYMVPNPDYTWVPKTSLVETPRTTTRMTTTTTTTTTTAPTETTDPSDTTDPDSTTAPASTTMVDPDGFGPLPPTPVTVTTTDQSGPPSQTATPGQAPTTTAPPS